MMSNTSRNDVAQRVIEDAHEDTDLTTHPKVGGEQFHPDVGHYYRHGQLQVAEVDTNDEEVLKEISRLCDEYGLEVDTKGDFTFATDDTVLLAVDWEAHE